ncbi:MAG: chaperone modulator CbpM [Sulfuricellaceae bacterium]|jgi:chaperone modulatory protein CbpM
MNFESYADCFSLLDDSRRATLSDLMRVSGLNDAELLELVEFGVFEPVEEGATPLFAAHSLILARKAGRLRRDFGANVPGLALALIYLQRIEELESRLRELECQLPR